MILIGQYDSSFTRRVAIAMRIYGMKFEHRPWSITRDADKIRAHNPLLRVPTLVLESGTVLTESSTIIDYLDSRVPEERRLFAVVQPRRHLEMRIASLATGLAEKGAALFLERALHAEPSRFWIDRCLGQIAGTLALLEQDRAAVPTPFWHGDAFGHADIAVACCLRHSSDANPGLVNWGDFPQLARHCQTLEALPLFAELSQPFDAPA